MLEIFTLCFRESNACQFWGELKAEWTYSNWYASKILKYNWTDVNRTTGEICYVRTKMKCSTARPQVDAKCIALMMMDWPAAFQTVKRSDVEYHWCCAANACTQLVLYYNYYSTVSTTAKTHDWLPPNDRSHDSNTIFN